MNQKIIIQGPALAGRTPDQLSLAPGQTATIGICHCGECDLDLRIDVDEDRPRIGRIEARDNHWSLSNLSAEEPLTVMNMEDWYQYLVVEPGRRDVPIPFELTQIELSASPEGPKVAVFGHEPRYAARRRPPHCWGTADRRPLLDRRSTYFSVLSELCRGRLDGVMDASLPTSAEIAEKLRPRYRTISPGAVDAHIKYVSEKLRLPKGTGRDALVAVLIRSNLLKQPS
jgi:hypothetical protein